MIGPQRAREFLELSGERMNPAFGALGHRPITRVTEPALHVTEGVEVRDEFDADLRAGVIKFSDLRRRQRRRVLPGVFVSAEGEGVFDVELELVDAHPAQRADEREEFRLRRHARA